MLKFNLDTYKIESTYFYDKNSEVLIEFIILWNKINLTVNW